MPEKKIQVHMQFEPMTSAIPVSVTSQLADGPTRRRQLADV